MNSAMNKTALDTSSSDVQLSPESRGINLRVARSLRMHRSVALGVAALFFVVLIGLGLIRRPQYEAQSLIYIQPAAAKSVTDVTSGSYDSSRYDSYIQQQLQTITRPDILAEALGKLPNGTWRFPKESEQAAIARLQSSLKVERIQGSYEVGISLKGSDPASVTKVVNEVTAAFLRRGRGDELAQSDQQLHLLKDDRRSILDELTRDRGEQARLSSALGVADTTGDTGNPYDVQLEELRKQVAAARSAHDVAVAQLTSISGKGTQSSEELNAASDEMIATDPGLSTLKSSITERRSLLTSQMAGLTPTNPLYKQDEHELARLDESLVILSLKLRGQAAQQLQGKLKLEVARTADVQRRLENELGRQTSVATGATPKLQRASDLAANIARLQARFTETDNAIHTIELQNGSAGLVHLSLAAVQPQNAASSRRILILLLALPIALCCGTFAAVILQMLDKRVYIGEDIGNALRFQPMAVLPNPKDVDARVTDEFLLRLVAGVDHAHRIGDAKTYVFTAASPGMNITGLIDALMERMNQIGYRTMVLRASAALKSLAPADEEFSTGWNETRLTKPAGARLAHVKRDSFVVENLERLKQNVDLLFINTLPILASAEAEFVARLADVTIIVAESAHTTRRELTNSLALVQRLSAAGVAAVLMDVSLRHADDDFVAAVRSVESRPHDTEPPASFYEDPDLVTKDGKSSSRR